MKQFGEEQIRRKEIKEEIKKKADYCGTSIEWLEAQKSRR